MASISKHGDGWRVQVYRRGIRRSKVFPSKAAAKSWGARQEYLIDQKRTGSGWTFSEVMARYAREVSPSKRGARYEILRLEFLALDPIGKIRVSDIEAKHVADWRDRRLKTVEPGTVLRERNLLSAVWTMARKEWGLTVGNPFSAVRWPATPKPRDRVPTPEEWARLEEAATGALWRVWQAFRFSCETAMRQGEIARLRRSDVTGRVAHLPITKNGDARDVPLSSEALAILDAIGPINDHYFPLAATISRSFAKLTKRAGVEGLTFHDGRRYGTSKLAGQLDVMTLAKVTGHRDVNLLLRVYYRTDMQEVAKRLG